MVGFQFFIITNIHTYITFIPPYILRYISGLCRLINILFLNTRTPTDMSNTTSNNSNNNNSPFMTVVNIIIQDIHIHEQDIFI